MTRSEPQRDDIACVHSEDERTGPRVRTIVTLVAALVLGWLPAGAEEVYSRPACPAPREASDPPGDAGALRCGAEAPRESAQPSTVAPPDSETTPAAPATPTVSGAAFLIEKIVVEGVRHGSAKIVAAETLLTLGRSYTEPQLQQALQRVERLPFVVQADFSLRRGSDRGRFELVINVTDTKPVFFGGAFDVSKYDGPSGRADWHSIGRPEVGGRLFLGDHSEIRASVSQSITSDDHLRPDASLSYTHHNLFARHVVGTLVLSRASGSGSASSNANAVSAQLALPLNGADALELGVSRAHSDLEADSGYRSWLTGSSVSLNWRHDTTDDPFTARRGTRAAVGVGYSTRDFRSYSPYGVALTLSKDEAATGDNHDDSLSGSLAASHYWPLSRRLSFGLEASFSPIFVASRETITLGDTVLPYDRDRWNTQGALKARLLGTVPWSRGGTRQYWWEVSASLFDSRLWSHRSTSGALSASIASRGRWGTVVLALQYNRSLYSGWQ